MSSLSSRLDICIPAYNEAEIIDTAIETLTRALSALPCESRIIVVDNGSTDGTAQRVRDAGRAHVSVLTISEQGKGAAIRAAARASDAEWFGFIDADLSADPDDIPKLFSLLAGGETNLVIGSRLADTRMVEREFIRTLSSQFFNALRRLILGIAVKDSQCGLKLMDGKGKALASACRETGWFFDMELLARAERAGLGIREVPVHWDEHRFPGRLSKLKLVRDGFSAVAAMVRIRRTLTVS